MQRATKPIHFPKFTRNLRYGWGKLGLSRPSNALDYWILGQIGDDAGLEIDRGHAASPSRTVAVLKINPQLLQLSKELQLFKFSLLCPLLFLEEGLL